uniref:Myomesin 3 n=1 Tax=Astyanax mexicanus TaxID=7994 RepID=A0A3B1JXM4_ASTMX
MLFSSLLFSSILFSSILFSSILLYSLLLFFIFSSLPFYAVLFFYILCFSISSFLFFSLTCFSLLHSSFPFVSFLSYFFLFSILLLSSLLFSSNIVSFLFPSFLFSCIFFYPPLFSFFLLFPSPLLSSLLLSCLLFFLFISCFLSHFYSPLIYSHLLSPHFSFAPLISYCILLSHVSFLLFSPLFSSAAPLVETEALFDSTFPPSFVKEGETLVLSCGFTSPLLPFQQDVSWFRDGEPLRPSGRVEVQTALRSSTLTLRGAHKEHEGFYSTRLQTRDGPQEHSAFIYIRDGAAAVVGAAGSPLQVECSDVNRDYVFLSWKPPSADGAAPVQGYYIERCEVGLLKWSRCNEVVQKVCYYPVMGLQENTMYQFRVCAVNQAGVGRPSKPTEPILTSDPMEPSRTMGNNSLSKNVMAKTGTHQVKGVPAAPHCIQAVADTDSSAVLLWKEPKNTEGILGYYLYCSEVGTSNWRTINNKPVNGTRSDTLQTLQSYRMSVEPPKRPVVFTVHGLNTNKDYVFRVKSVGRAGNSHYSEESQPVRIKAAKVVPSPPSGVCLLHCSGSEMVIGWRAPANQGGEAVKGYFLDQREKPQTVWREVNPKPVKERVYKVSALLEGHYYQFRLFASNVIGLSKPSQPSEAFLCEPWTMPEPGCPYDLELREVRRESLVVMWAEPLYQGQSQITGYVVEISQGEESEDWTEVTQESVTDRHLKISGLRAGQTYRLRVSAVNSAGVGRPSLPTEPITAQTKPGTKDMEIGVDNDGFIFLSFQASETAEDGQFKWNKNYRETIDAGRAHLETKHKTSVLTFTAASEEDLGLYTAEMMDSPGVSSSYNFTARKINFDKPNGLVEILFDQLSKEDEGSYTAQLKDGRAKNQFTLVLVDESRKEAGVYRAVVSDSRGEDESILELVDTEKKMDQGERNAPGSSMQKVWNEIFNPTENDKGKYTLEMFDGQETHKRHLDLSGQGTAFCQCFFLDRAKVTKGLPDVVAIMEGKSLCLTCFADGDPAPEMFWLKNDREITSTGQYHIAHENKCTTITISSVTMEDSGNYSIFVRNSYGSQTVHISSLGCVWIYRYYIFIVFPNTLDTPASLGKNRRANSPQGRPPPGQFQR